ncbi:MAG: antiviral reverse transcriptase Drt3a [Ferruginibacter sp.]
MLDQSYSVKSFKRLISVRDFGKYELGKNEREIIASLTEVAVKTNNTDYNFTSLSQIEDDDNIIYTPTTIEDEFALRKLNDNLKRLYKFKQANRFLIIEQINSLLLEEVPMSIIKLDIKKFYETIDKERILKKLLDDPLLSFHSKQLLKKFFSLPEVVALSGLPRGINISAALSEILMRDFDKKISQQPGVYFYARYVDDIILFTFKNPKDIVKKTSEILDFETGLKLNTQKTKIIERQCRCIPVCTCVGACKCHAKCKCTYDVTKEKFFEYLGYRFTFSDLVKYSNKLIITLSKSRVKKMKTRIILSFLDFIKSNDFDLLEKRVTFLTSNFVIKRNKKMETLNAGVFYNYPHINEAGLTELERLTLFLRKTINAKNHSFGSKLTAKLTTTNRLSLSKYCFKAGFINRRLKHYTPKEINAIKKCWIYG